MLMDKLYTRISRQDIALKMECLTFTGMGLKAVMRQWKSSTISPREKPR